MIVNERMIEPTPSSSLHHAGYGGDVYSQGNTTMNDIVTTSTSGGTYRRTGKTTSQTDNEENDDDVPSDTAAEMIRRDDGNHENDDYNNSNCNTAMMTSMPPHATSVRQISSGEGTATPTRTAKEIELEHRIAILEATLAEVLSRTTASSIRTSTRAGSPPEHLVSVPSSPLPPAVPTTTLMGQYYPPSPGRSYVNTGSRGSSLRRRRHRNNRSSQSLKCHFVPTEDLDESSEEEDLSMSGRSTTTITGGVGGDNSTIVGDGINVAVDEVNGYTGFLVPNNDSITPGHSRTSSLVQQLPLSDDSLPTTEDGDRATTLLPIAKSTSSTGGSGSVRYGTPSKRSSGTKSTRHNILNKNNNVRRTISDTRKGVDEDTFTTPPTELYDTSNLNSHDCSKNGETTTTILSGETVQLPFQYHHHQFTPQDASIASAPRRPASGNGVQMLRQRSGRSSSKGEVREEGMVDQRINQSSRNGATKACYASPPPTPPPSVEYRAFSDAQVAELRRRSNSIMSSSEQQQQDQSSSNGIVVPRTNSKDLASPSSLPLPTLIHGSSEDAVGGSTTLSPIMTSVSTAPTHIMPKDESPLVSIGEDRASIHSGSKSSTTFHETTPNTNNLAPPEDNNKNNKNHVSPLFVKQKSTSSDKIDTMGNKQTTPTSSSTTTGPGTLDRATSYKPLKDALGYVKLEMFGNKDEGSPEKDCDRNMEEFLRVPSRLEKLLSFGMIVCLDCYLNVLTFLPIKVVFGFVCLFYTGLKRKHNSKFVFSRKYLYKMLQFLNCLTVYHVLYQISVGKLYHWVRGQTMMKLYLVVAIVEVFDRLMCSFGQDALDGMYWNTTRRPYHLKMVASYIIASVYVLLHSLVLMVHITTLNVAMNSADTALISLLIGGNFAEIKSTVFKKYNKKNLFQIAMSDICERFKLYLFMFLITVLNLAQGGNPFRTIQRFVQMGFIIMSSEILSDWIKHSFITKFNFIPSNVYEDYALIIAGDVTGIGHQENVNIDHTHAVVKRVGLAQLPLLCITMRYLTEALRYSYTRTLSSSSTSDSTSIACWCVISFLLLLLIKIITGLLLSKVAERTVLEISRNKATAPESTTESSNSSSRSKDSKPHRKVV